MALLGGATGGLIATSATASVGVDTSALVNAVTPEGIRVHLEEFQRFADESDGTRAASTDGYLDSALYVSQLMIEAGYEVDLQVFPFLFFANNSPAELSIVSPDPLTFELGEPDGFVTGTYSGSGTVTANATPVDVQIPPGAEGNSSTSGCEADDFEEFPAGDIAVVQRGNCPFFDKALNAQNAGATGVIVFNEGQEGRSEAFGGTLGGPGITIPVVFTAFSIGETLAAGGSEVSLAVDVTTENRITANVLAESPIGRRDRTLVVGGHLDSVDEGPGINDNGSGSAAMLEIALQMAELGYLDGGDFRLNNRVRFAWWGAEELGLLGSEYYVANLDEEELEEIVVNLNFDMVASPNYVRFVYDGDGSASEPAGPEGSAFVEWIFRDWYEQQGLASAPTEFSGRSDYGPFIAVGIPAGGLFSGAEGIKTDEEAATFGGTAGVAYDECYHEACDTIENINDQALDEFSDAMANAVAIFATNALPVPRASKRSKSTSRADDGVQTDYRGNLLVR